MILCFILVTHKNNTYCEPFLAKKVYLFSSICFFPKLFTFFKLKKCLKLVIFAKFFIRVQALEWKKDLNPYIHS